MTTRYVPVSEAEQPFRVRVVCTELPGRRFCEPAPGGRTYEPVFLGVQRGKEVVDVVMADADHAEFLLDFRVGEQKNGKPNFLSDYAQGTPGDRFFYLVWTERSGSGLKTFRRLKVRLGHLSWESVRRSVGSGEPARVTLRLTDKRGAPLCATPPPEHVAWHLP